METALATTRTNPEQVVAEAIEQAEPAQQAMSVRTYSIDEATHIINEAEALQFLDEDLQHRDRQLEARLGATRITEDALMTTAGQMNVRPQYIQRIIQKRYPTLEEQLAPLRLLGSRPTYRVLAQAYMQVIEQACKRALPADLKFEYRRDFCRYYLDIRKTFKHEYTTTPTWFGRWCGERPATHTSYSSWTTQVGEMFVDDHHHSNAIQLDDLGFAKIVAEPLAAFNKFMERFFPGGIYVSHTFLPADCVDGLRL